MKQEIITSYSEYDKTGLTIEDYYEYKLENDEDFEMSKEEFIEKYNDSNEFYDWLEDEWVYSWEDYFHDVCYEADKIFSKNLVKVVGGVQRWNGSREVDTIISETTLKDIIAKWINVDMLEVEVYSDKVVLRNIHHDGTNYYELFPFDFGELTKKELLARVDKEHYEWYGDKLYKATKDDLINYLNDNLEN